MGHSYGMCSTLNRQATQPHAMYMHMYMHMYMYMYMYRLFHNLRDVYVSWRLEHKPQLQSPLSPPSTNLYIALGMPAPNAHPFGRLFPLSISVCVYKAKSSLISANASRVRTCTRPKL